jgi:hypothetical protein
MVGYSSRKGFLAGDGEGGGLFCSAGSTGAHVVVIIQAVLSHEWAFYRELNSV